MSEKHIAFLMTGHPPFGIMMFPDYYENIKEEIDAHYEDTGLQIEGMRWQESLSKSPYKVFKIKEIVQNEEQNSNRTGTEEQTPPGDTPTE